MKFLLFFLLFTSISLSANENKEREYLLDAHEEAVRLIETALLNSQDNPFLKGHYYNRLLKVLENVDYEHPITDDTTFSTCNPGTAAFTYLAPKNRFINSFTPNKIFLCRNPKAYRKGALSQIIIHEAIHRIGISDHCMVSSMEVDIYYNANKTLENISVYYFDCNIYVPENIRPSLIALFPYNGQHNGVISCYKNGHCRPGNKNISEYQNIFFIE